MAAPTHARQFPFVGALILWAGLLLFGIIAGLRLNYDGRRFAIAILVAATLLGVELFIACPRVRERLSALFAGTTFFLAPLIPLIAFLLYALNFYPSDWLWVLAGVLYVAVPSLLTAGARGKPAGALEDYLALFIIWLPVQFRWMYRLWPHPPQLTHTLTILFALTTALAAFLFIRRLDGIGYAVEWRHGFGWAVLLNFLLLAVIIIPLGETIRFIHFGPTAHSLKATPLTGLEILVFTAWPEEFLFRGLLQNLLSRSLKNRYAGWIIASVAFGFAHILHAPVPNWKYVCLATIAGLFYGRSWMKTGSLVPGAIIHALVDSIWFGFFPR
ncbi:MAG: type II CAAX endopeptidase family protein [Candidatus Acidiferrales bacterium]